MITLTNFRKEERPRYEKAIQLYGKDDIYIKDEAFDCSHNLLKDCNSLRTNTLCDKTKFWRIFDSLE